MSLFAPQVSRVFALDVRLQETLTKLAPPPADKSEKNTLTKIAARGTRLMLLQSMCAHHMRSPTDKSEDEGIESRLSNSDSLVTAESQPLASRITSLSSSRKSGSFLSSNRINISSSSAFPRSPPLLAEFAKGARWFSSSSCTLAVCCCRRCCW